MSGPWKKDNKEQEAALLPEKYTQRNLANTKDLQKEIYQIESNQALSYFDKVHAKRQLMHAVSQAKRLEIQHHLESYENYLLARKDIEARTIAVEAQKAIMALEREQLNMMKDMGMEQSMEVTETLSRLGQMFTQKLEEIEAAHMTPEIKTKTLQGAMRIFNKTWDRIEQSVDSYVEQLQQNEKERKGGI